MTKTQISRIARRHAVHGLALALLAAAPALHAQQAGYYRWKDDKGQFQATQQPPSDRPSEFVRLSTGKSTPVAAGETVDGNGNKGETGAAADKPPARPAGTIEGVPNPDQDKCREARQAQSVLDSHARVRVKGDSGEYRYLEPDEVEEQKRIAKQSADVYCESAK